MKTKILFISSNPTKNLSLDEEYRAIEQSIQRSPNRDSIELKTKLATRVEDLIEALNTERPHIIHFSGHGQKSGELVFTSNDRTPEPIPLKALKNLFGAIKDSIKLIFLNACYSKIQAEAINEEIDFVIGMNAPIYDDTAIIFSSTFYNSLASNRTIKEAFAQAKVMVEVRHPKEETVPELLIKEGVDDLKLVEVDVNQNSNQAAINQTHNGDGDNIGRDKIVNNSTTNTVKGDLYGVQSVGNGGSVTQTFNIDKKK